jgi:signal transduction histidine kinase
MDRAAPLFARRRARSAMKPRQRHVAIAGGMLVLISAEIVVGFAQFGEAAGSATMRAWIAAATTLAVVATGGTGLLLLRSSVRQGRLEADRLAAEEMRRAEQLAELGRMAASVAHEIHNPLQGVHGYLALLDRDSGDPERRRAHVAAIRAALQRVERLTRDLLDIANPAPPHRVAIAPFDLLHNLDKSLAADPRFDGVAREIYVESGVPSMLADPSAMERVLFNLAHNAQIAQDGKGKIYFCARRAPAGGVEIEVSDDGPGVDDSQRAHLFEPFRSGRGSTGLGLWICDNLVRASGGTIHLDAARTAAGRGAAAGPRGARFVMTIPESHG